MHIDEKQDNDRHKDAFINENARVRGTAPHQIVLFSTVKFTQTETTMYDFPLVFMCFLFLSLNQGTKKVFKTI